MTDHSSSLGTHVGRRALMRFARAVRRQGEEFARRLGRPPVADAVRQALALPPAQMKSCPASTALAELLRGIEDAKDVPGVRDLFFLDGKPLPCWSEADTTLFDGWLCAENYYPVYFCLYRVLTRQSRVTRLLEIGVRTGYQGVVFAKACQGRAFYVGVDPDLYVRDGLQRAGDTFRILRERLQHFEFCLIRGYSWDRDVECSLSCSGPFDLVHIDGDHTLRGKLADLDLARHLLARDGIVLVDDYDHQASVADAIGRSLALGWYREFAYYATFRGLALLRA